MPAGVQWNHAYFPILVDAGFAMSRDALYQLLRDHGIHGRRYFYPLISDFPMYRGLPSADPQRLPNARRAAEQVICLPMYPSLADEEVQRIGTLIREAAKPALDAEPHRLAA
jgi:dTDP-4-amino-4,6-dideoxygalactose transaminase